MSRDPVDAVGALLKAQVMHVRYLPGDPTATYTVRAPCLLAQLQAAIGASSGGRGGRTVPSSRPPVAVDALDLWVEVVTNAHGWAASLDVDRRPYMAPETGPGSPWSADRPLSGVIHASRATRSRAAQPAAVIPPVGQLLRAVAAQSIALGRGETAERIAHRADGWADRIRIMLDGWATDERIYPLRGVTCAACGARTVVDDRTGERLVVPAVEVRFMALDAAGDPADLGPYRWCLACGDAGWLPYRSETGSSAPGSPPAGPPGPPWVAAR